MKIGFNFVVRALTLGLAISMVSSVSAQELSGTISDTIAGAGSGTQLSSAAPQTVKARGFSSESISSRKGRRVSFVGSWYTTVRKKIDSCNSTTPASLNIGLQISSSLDGTDIGDGSPFFTGRKLSRTSIGFSRMFSQNGCTISQVYVLSKVAGARAFSTVDSTTTCGASICKTRYVGNSTRR